MKIPIDLDRILKAKTDIIQVSDKIDQLFGDEVKAFLAETKNALALKYLLIESVEAITDICQHLLAKTKGIICEGYVDCIVKTGEAGIISSSLAQKLRKLAELRNIIVHRYWVIDDKKVYIQTLENKKYLIEFVGRIEKYMDSFKK
jgi:uncharacterized protein YutE (UPF0331/DUF86 family)